MIMAFRSMDWVQCGLNIAPLKRFPHDPHLPLARLPGRVTWTLSGFRFVPTVSWCSALPRKCSRKTPPAPLCKTPPAPCLPRPGGEEDILGLQIHVHNGVLLQVRQAAQHLVQQAGCRRLAQPQPQPDPLTQLAALQQLWGKEARKMNRAW